MDLICPAGSKLQKVSHEVHHASCLSFRWHQHLHLYPPERLAHLRLFLFSLFNTVSGEQPPSADTKALTGCACRKAPYTKTNQVESALAIIHSPIESCELISLSIAHAPTRGLCRATAQDPTSLHHEHALSKYKKVIWKNWAFFFFFHCCFSRYAQVWPCLRWDFWG